MDEYIKREAAKRAVDEAVELSASEYDMICDYLDRIPPPTLRRWCTAVTADPTISRGWDGAQSTSTAKVRTTFVATA